MVIYTSKYVDTVTIFQKKINQKVNDPMTFDPTSVEVPWKYIKLCEYSDPFFQ